MCKVLIVEDEANSREGLFNLLAQKSELSIAKACDGEEGYRKCLEQKPDIIFTDIRMPGIDGLQMIGKIKSSGLEPECIILTGYAEFKYAQRAIKLGVCEYLLKPILPENVFKILGNAIAKVHSRKLLMPLDRMNVNVMSDDDIRLIARFYGDQTNRLYCVMLIYDPAKVLKKFFQKAVRENPDVLLIKERDSCSKGFLNLIFPYSKNSQTMKSRINILCKGHNNIACAYVFLKDLNQLGTYFRRLLQNINFCISSGGYLIDCSHLPLHTNSGRIGSSEYSEAYHKALCEEDYISCSKLLTHYLRNLQGKGFYPDDILKFTVKQLFMLTPRNSRDASHITQIEFYHKFMTSVTPYEVETRIQNYVHEFLHQDSSLIYSKPVETVICEIEKNYNKPISLNSIADQLKITPQYLSRIFLKETNMNFIDFLTRVRIEKAKVLIKTSNLKIFEIAEKVGYLDAKYFCTTFKKYVGTSPNQYKYISNSKSVLEN